jgi:hypothetical protein
MPSSACALLARSPLGRKGAKRSRRTVAGAVGGILMAVATTFATGFGFADQTISDEAAVRSCVGDDSGLPHFITTGGCTFVVTRRHSQVWEFSAVNGLAQGSGCASGRAGEVNGTFGYAVGNSYSFSGSVSITTGPIIKISGGGAYSKRRETGYFSAGGFRLAAGEKGRIIIGRMFESVDGAWQIDITADGGPLPGPPSVTTRRIIHGQHARFPVAGPQPLIDVERRGCNEPFEIPEGDAQVLLKP